MIMILLTTAFIYVALVDAFLINIKLNHRKLI